MSERWLPVAGYVGSYEVSDTGRVRSLDRTVRSKGSGHRLSVGRVLRAFPVGDGYAQVSLSRDGRQAGKLVHILVLEAFVGPCPAGMETRHLDGDLSNNLHGNLRWGTPAENTADKRTHGTMPCGERSGSAKLTQADVDEIRVFHAQGWANQAQIARAYDVTPRTIHLIVRNRTWKEAS